MTLVARIRAKGSYWVDCARLRYRATSRRLRSVRPARATAPTLLVLPQRLHPKSVLFTLTSRAGIRTTRHSVGSAYDVALFWQNETFRVLPAQLEGLTCRVLNRNCVDISKSRVSRAFEDAFGYGLAIAPQTHRGIALEKPEQNAAHVGRQVTCPMVARPGYAYQRMVDNVHGEHVQDIRAVKIGAAVPLTYLKYRPVGTRFSNTNSHAVVAEPSEVLFGDETVALLRMAEDLGIDYGEFDCLRDLEDGRLYVVDANPTPWGPPNHLSPADAERAMSVMQRSFTVLVEDSRRQDVEHGSEREREREHPYG